jgi:hypothetical protein
VILSVLLCLAPQSLSLVRRLDLVPEQFGYEVRHSRAAVAVFVTNGHAFAQRIPKHKDAITPTIRFRLYMKSPPSLGTACS